MSEEKEEFKFHFDDPKMYKLLEILPKWREKEELRYQNYLIEKEIGRRAFGHIVKEIKDEMIRKGEL